MIRHDTGFRNSILCLGCALVRGWIYVVLKGQQLSVSKCLQNLQKVKV